MEFIVNIAGALFVAALVGLGFVAYLKNQKENQDSREENSQVAAALTSDDDGPLKSVVSDDPGQTERQEELLGRIETLEKQRGRSKHSLLRKLAGIGSFVFGLIFLLILVGGLFLPFLPIGLITNPGPLFNSSTYWGAGLPDCDSSFAKAQIRKHFVEIPLVAMTKSYPREVRNIKRVFRSDEMQYCEAIVSTSNGPVKIGFRFERDVSESHVFWFSLNILDAGSLSTYY